MRISTIFLQLVCAALGTLLVVLAFAAGRELLGFCLFLASLMFFFAAILGADHTTNTSSGSRRFFKILMVLSACPLAVVGMYNTFGLLLSAHWLDAASSLLRVAVFIFAILCGAFDDHPKIRRVMNYFGLSTPKK